MLSGGKEAWNPNTAEWLENKLTSEADLLPICGTG